MAPGLPAYETQTWRRSTPTFFRCVCDYYIEYPRQESNLCAPGFNRMLFHLSYEGVDRGS